MVKKRVKSARRQDKNVSSVPVSSGKVQVGRTDEQGGLTGLEDLREKLAVLPTHVVG